MFPSFVFTLVFVISASEKCSLSLTSLLISTFIILNYTFYIAKATIPHSTFLIPHLNLLVLKLFALLKTEF